MFVLKLNLKTLVFAVFVFFVSSLNAQAEGISTVIPYEIKSGKMIVKMNIYGSTESFVFDTGAAQSALEASFIQKHKLEASDSIKVTDVNSVKSYYKLFKINSLQTPDKAFHFSEFNVLMIPAPSMFECLGTVGIIGSDIFQNLICTIDSKSQTITLSNSNKVPKESLRYAHNFATKDIIPTFNMLINGESVIALFDTGTSSFIDLMRSDADKLIAQEAISVVDTGFGSSAVGVSGVLSASNSYRVTLPNVRIGPVRIKNGVVEVANTPFTLVGTEMMKYMKSIIDYPRRRIYIIPLSDEEIEYNAKSPNLGITIKDGNLVIAVLWSEYRDKLSIYDKITHVNGVPTGIYEMCDIVNGISLLKGDEPKTLTVRRNDGSIVEVTYRKEVTKI